MTISVTQEETKWQPVTIVIDDKNTAKLLMGILQEYCFKANLQEDAPAVVGIYMVGDTRHTFKEIRDLKVKLEQICQ